MPYKFIEDIAVADVAFEATGKTLEELFESAALATTNVMIRNLESIKPKVKKTVKIQASDVENLLHKFLSEIVFLKDAKRLVFISYKLKIDEKKNSLEAVLYGDKLDRNKQIHIVDVKAVTWHLFKVEKTQKGWRAQVILDI
ncbi:MAG TPA: archease [archaeon]|nr:archease [archaeon]